ncbi:F-box domain-containing protein [Favolaschia claudopus]|uniref:F-box domain-containing protein n=1 Tax=Favolaschia claudopus TaxID=2862362 RepID=A0AAW0BZX0_9AGAR
MLRQLELDRAFIAEKDTQIFQLEAQISALQRSLSSLQADKRTVQQRLDSYQYPVLTLPNEIVSEIFLRCLPPYPTPPPLVGILSPTFLTQICRQWREVSHATPRLWRAIDLTESDDDDDSLVRDDFQLGDDQRASLATLWMRRAGGCALSIIAFNAEPIISSLIPHRSQWEHIKLYGVRADISPSIFEEATPRLRTLEVYTFGPSSIHAPVQFRVQDAPLLRRVLLPIDGGMYPVLPWTQLTHLDLHKVSGDDCANVLGRVPQLVDCNLTLRRHNPELTSSDDHAPDILLRSLEHLRLDLDIDSVADPKFIHRFVVPSLRSLQIPEVFIQPNPVESLKKFISKSGCKLEDLFIIEPVVAESLYRTEFPSIARIECELDSE